MNQTKTKIDGRFAYLQLINEDNNNNRFYRMCESGNVIIVEFGRNGAAAVTQKKPLSLWDAIYNKKIAEGYVETAEYQKIVTEEKHGDYQPIENLTVRKFFNSIMHYADKELKTKYYVSWESVTPEMIQKAQNIITELDNCKDITACCEMLRELFAIIPRKMKNVKDHLPTKQEQMGEILQKEQELLDVLINKIEQEKITKKAQKGMTVLDALNLSVRLCSPEENKKILERMTSESAGRFKRAFRVQNAETDKRFNNYMKEHKLTEDDIYFLYHGSRNQNYYGLITQGPLLNPNAPITGKMFGHGIYFANRAKKSIGYTSGGYWTGGNANQAFLAVYKVCYKNPKHVKKWNDDMPRYNASRIAPYDAVFAHGGADLINDEIIIYNEAQCTLQYIIELQ